MPGYSTAQKEQRIIKAQRTNSEQRNSLNFSYTSKLVYMDIRHRWVMFYIPALDVVCFQLYQIILQRGVGMLYPENDTSDSSRIMF